MAVSVSWKFGIGFLMTLCIVGGVYFGYFYCTGASCALRGNRNSIFKSNYEAYLSGKYLQNKFPQNELNKDFNIDLDNQDVIVFLHIQKTGGTIFGKHLVENLEVDPPCYCYMKVKKHCDCLNKRKEVWLFSRYSTGWRCGLHADWTELTSCVNDWFDKTYGKRKRNYHYITMLRDPVPRFISEWMHVRRGATWKTAGLKCNGREATLQEVPFCYDSEDWRGVTLQEFMDCPHNLAFNRQTRMLANMTTVHCYDTVALPPSRRDTLLLASAKANLRRMAYFGLVEFQAYSQQLFQHSLHMRFLHDFAQHNVTHSSQRSFSAEDVRRIAELNHLDVELYQFAKDLFLQRVRQMFVDKGMDVPEQLENLIGREAAAGPQPMEIADVKSDPTSSEQVAGLPVDGAPSKKKAGDLGANTLSRKEMFGQRKGQHRAQLNKYGSMGKRKAGDSRGRTLSGKRVFGNKKNDRLSAQFKNGYSMGKDDTEKGRAGDLSKSSLSEKRMFGKQSSPFRTWLGKGGREDPLGQQQGRTAVDDVDDESRFSSSDSQHRTETSDTRHQQSRLSSLIKDQLSQSRFRR